MDRAASTHAHLGPVHHQSAVYGGPGDCDDCLRHGHLVDVLALHAFASSTSSVGATGPPWSVCSSFHGCFSNRSWVAEWLMTYSRGLVTGVAGWGDWGDRRFFLSLAGNGVHDHDNQERECHAEQRSQQALPSG